MITLDKKHILLIDDDHELADLLVDYLTGQGFAVHCCFDGQSGLKKAYDEQIDLILLDVMMPKLNGFEVLKALGNQHPTPILMLTAKGDNDDKVKGLELGADDYLAKPFHAKELLARIQAILRRITITQSQPEQNHPEHKSILSFNAIEVNHAAHQVTCLDNIVELTSVEYQILALLMENVGEVISKDKISTLVLKRKLMPFDRSIDVHIGNIRRKFASFCEDEKIKTIRGSGYLFLSGDSNNA